MAEVLITLGIIGVVAAMTMPSLIQNYRKVQAVTRLKKAYTTISQAFTRAQAEYGDYSSWYSLATDSRDDDTENLKIKEDVEKYILPYLTNVITAEYTTFSELGYTSYTTVNGEYNTNLWSESRKYFIIEMSDSITYFFSRNTNGNMLIYVDINGIKTNNIWGRDAFIFTVDKNNKFIPYSYSSVTSTITRANNLSECASLGRTCAALIMQDGWQIKDDYPIRF